MITQEQIDSWIKEAEERPSSAGLIIQFIANRLRDLTARNEELSNENIALMSGKRVEEYEKRIAHLEYQLELLKRQVAGDQSGVAESGIPTHAVQPASQQTSLLFYIPSGEVLRVAFSRDDVEDGRTLTKLASLPPDTAELRMLAVQESSELLFMFSSGRIETLPASDIQLTHSTEMNWNRATLPAEPYAGESLSVIAPISNLALKDFIVQASRKGCLKKMSASLAQSILDKHFIGTGVKAQTDRSFEMLLCGKEDRLAVVSQEGFLANVDVKRLPFNIEEALRLGSGDHLVAGFILPLKGQVLIMTQIGKVVHLEAENLEATSSAKSRGQAVLSAKRRESGVRVVGAGVFSAGDWAAALHRNGTISLHAAQALFDQGALPTSSELLAFITLPAVFQR